MMQLKEVAILIGVVSETVANWETGATVPQPKDGPGIVSFLGLLPLPTETLAQRLYAVRFMSGWTQEQAADACGVSEDGWQVWERGETPSKQTLAVLDHFVIELLSPAEVI